MAIVGLVTVLYHSDEVLPDFIKSLGKQSFKNYHLYLVDNTPNSITDELLKKLLLKYPLPAYTHLKNSYNAGIATGNNQGIREALSLGCDYILLLNNDIAIESPLLLEDMIAYAKNQHEYLLVPKLLFYDSRKICMAGGSFNRYYATTEHIGADQEDSETYNIAGYFNYAPTTFMLISRRVFEDIGLMDSRYFVYYDDTDFIYRATLHGYEVYYMPSLVVLHKESSLTGGNRSPFFVYYINRNRIYFIRKHFHGWQKIRALAAMGLDSVRMFRHYSNKQRKVLVKALWHGLFRTL